MARLDERKMRMLEDRIEDLRIKDKGLEKRKVMDGVFDQPTLLVFYKLISDGHLDTLDYVVSSGKEAKVFHGTAPDGSRRAVKVYLVTNAVFRHILPYIHGDPRFDDFERNRRSIVMTWAKKEYGNLQAYRTAGLRVPEPSTVEKNVLIMEFVGDEDGPAPLLQELDVDDPQPIFDDVVDQIETGVQDAELVHADVSQFNVLLWRAEPWIIDCGQAVSLHHPNAREFLERDLDNLCTYFRKLGVDADPDALFDRITDGVSI